MWIVLFSEVTSFEDILNIFVANCCFFVSYDFTQFNMVCILCNILFVLTFRFSICCLFSQDPNQLIRGSALRVLSSIRVPVIAPIMMLAIKEVSEDDLTFLFYSLIHS